MNRTSVGQRLAFGTGAFDVNDAFLAADAALSPNVGIRNMLCRVKGYIVMFISIIIYGGIHAVPVLEKRDDGKKEAAATSSSALAVLASSLNDDWNRIPEAMTALVDELRVRESDEPTFREAVEFVAHAADDVMMSAACAVALEFRTIHEYFTHLWLSCHQQACSFVYERLALRLCLVNRHEEALRLRAHYFGKVDDVASKLDNEPLVNPGKHYQPIHRGPTNEATFRRMYFSRSLTEYEVNERPRLPNFCTSGGVVEAFHAITYGLMRDVLGGDLCTLCAAGGSVYNAATGKKPQDVDVFVVVGNGRLSAAARERLAVSAVNAGIRRLLFNAREGQDQVKVRVERTPGVVTVRITLSDERKLKVQFIKRVYALVEQVPLSFDIDVAKWIYDGSHVYCTDSAYRAARSQTFFVNPLMATYAGRFVKYVRLKGLHCVVPTSEGLCRMIGAFNTAYDSGHGPEHRARLKVLAKDNTLASIMALHRLWERHSHSHADDLNGTYCSVQPDDHPTSTLDGVDCDFATAVEGEWEVENPCKRMVVESGTRFLGYQ
jgi:hypothetical protein